MLPQAHAGMVWCAASFGGLNVLLQQAFDFGDYNSTRNHNFHDQHHHRQRGDVSMPWSALLNRAPAVTNHPYRGEELGPVTDDRVSLELALRQSTQEDQFCRMSAFVLYRQLGGMLLLWSAAWAVAPRPLIKRSLGWKGWLSLCGQGFTGMFMNQYFFVLGLGHTSAVIAVSRSFTLTSKSTDENHVKLNPI
jgi:hypothetical protein